MFFSIDMVMSRTDAQDVNRDQNIPLLLETLSLLSNPVLFLSDFIKMFSVCKSPLSRLPIYSRILMFTHKQSTTPSIEQSSHASVASSVKRLITVLGLFDSELPKELCVFA